MIKTIKPYLFCAGIILACFLIAALLDIVLAAILPRFYSMALLAVTFGVFGIFASLFSFMTATDYATKNGKNIKWPVIIFLLAMGILCFTFFGMMEHGEYRTAFQSFGITLGLAAFLFAKDKPTK